MPWPVRLWLGCFNNIFWEEREKKNQGGKEKGKNEWRKKGKKDPSSGWEHFIPSHTYIPKICLVLGKKFNWDVASSALTQACQLCYVLCVGDVASICINTSMPIQQNCNLLGYIVYGVY